MQRPRPLLVLSEMPDHAPFRMPILPFSWYFRCDSADPMINCSIPFFPFALAPPTLNNHNMGDDMLSGSKEWYKENKPAAYNSNDYDRERASLCQ